MPKLKVGTEGACAASVDCAPKLKGRTEDACAISFDCASKLNVLVVVKGVCASFIDCAPKLKVLVEAVAALLADTDPRSKAEFCPPNFKPGSGLLDPILKAGKEAFAGESKGLELTIGVVAICVGVVEPGIIDPS